MCRELRAEYEAEHAQQMAAYKSLQEERAEAQHQKHLVFANETAWLMAGFAERAIKYRQDTDGAKVPKAQYRCQAACQLLFCVPASTFPCCICLLPCLCNISGTQA